MTTVLTSIPTDTTPILTDPTACKDPMQVKAFGVSLNILSPPKWCPDHGTVIEVSGKPGDRVLKVWGADTQQRFRYEIWKGSEQIADGTVGTLNSAFYTYALGL